MFLKYKGIIRDEMPFIFFTSFGEKIKYEINCIFLKGCQFFFWQFAILPQRHASPLANQQIK